MGWNIINNFQFKISSMAISVMLTSLLLCHAGQPSVRYIKSRLYGNFLMAPNMTIAVAGAIRILMTPNTCDCRVACFAIGNECKAWSTLKLEGDYECRMAGYGPGTTIPESQENANYFYKESSISGKYVWGEDKLLYMKMSAKYKYDQAKQRCARLPGHRLIIIKFQTTFNFFMNLTGSTYWIADLRKDGSNLVWGDGTLYQDTELTSDQVVIDGPVTEDVFVGHNSKLDDLSNADIGPFKVVCQANPFGVEW